MQTETTTTYSAENWCELEGNYLWIKELVEAGRTVSEIAVQLARGFDEARDQRAVEPDAVLVGGEQAVEDYVQRGIDHGFYSA